MTLYWHFLGVQELYYMELKHVVGIAYDVELRYGDRRLFCKAFIEERVTADTELFEFLKKHAISRAPVTIQR